jgi:hypothetical protein
LEYVKNVYKFDPRDLENKDFIKIINNENTINSFSLKSKATKLFDVKTISIESWIDEYINLFPKGIKSNNIYIHSNKPDCIVKMSKFFKKYKDITKEQVLEATKAYLERKKGDNFLYTQCSAYFIERNNLSTLLTEIYNLNSKPKVTLSKFNQQL